MSIITLFNVESVGVHSEPELLWTNGIVTDSTKNPVVAYPPSGDFQTITLDLSPYKAVIITSAKVQVQGGSTNVETGVTSPTTITIYNEVTHYVINKNDDSKEFSLGPFGGYYRPVIVTNNGITIYSMTEYDDDYTISGDPDEEFVPIYIYGIR